MATIQQAETPRSSRRHATAEAIADEERVRAEQRVYEELALRRRPPPPVNGQMDDLVEWTLLQLDRLDEARRPEHHPALLDWFPYEEALPSEQPSTYRDLWSPFFEGREGKSRLELAVLDAVEDGYVQPLSRLLPEHRIGTRHSQGRPEFDLWDQKFDGENSRWRRITLAAQDVVRIRDLWEQAYGSRRRPPHCPSAEAISAARWSKDGDIDEYEVKRRVKG